MILRRFMKHVSDQNWFAVGLDVCVVIVGIFLGMQVTDWNEARKDTRDSLGYLERIHNEIQLMEQSSGRVRSRRLNLMSDLEDAGGILFQASGDGDLNDTHCYALATSHYFHISVPDLPSLIELVSAGRVSIIADEALRTALISLQQAAGALQKNIENVGPIVHNLPVAHPDLIKSRPYFDDELREIQGRYICDLQAMKGNQAFLNKASENIDGFDVYLRDGLRPWNNTLDQVHHKLDIALGVTHEGGR